ncbi:MAG: tetratricopeptide repeat protein, partial [Candidatus Omnitrophota bacterium]
MFPNGYFNRIISALIVAFGFMVCPSSAYCAFNIMDLEKANALLRMKQFEKAQEKYDEIIENSTNAYYVAAANFNKAVSLYTEAEYQEATEYFIKAMATEDPYMEQKANYNIGNCKYKQSVECEEANLEASIQFCGEGLYFYKKAIDLNPKDRDAEYNYLACQKRIEELEKKQPQQKNEPEKAQQQKDLENQHQKQKQDLEQQQSQQTQDLEQQQQKQKQDLDNQQQKQQGPQPQKAQQQKDLENQHQKQTQDLEQQQSQQKQDLEQQQQKQKQD